MIAVRGLTRDFRTGDRAVAALGGVDLAIDAGSFVVLLGPSGSGKTTLLRCIAGLETPDDGEIEIDDEPVFSASRRLFVRPEFRRLGMVFQSYAVWPHLTVAQNVALPLRRGVNRIAATAVGERVERALAAVQLGSFADRPTTMLSGGQQQRVALARALAIEPRALLMDEPLSNLDARLREEIRAQIKSIVKAIGVTVLYVTHDQDEAMALADRIAVMDAGRIVQVGSPAELYAHPATPHVAEFFGSINWIAGTVRTPGRVDTALGVLRAPAARAAGDVVVGIRPEDVRLCASEPPADNELAATVLEQTFFGDHRIIRAQTANSVLTVKVGGDAGDLAGADVRLVLPDARLHVFAAAPTA